MIFISAEVAAPLVDDQPAVYKQWQYTHHNPTSWQLVQQLINKQVRKLQKLLLL